MTRVEMVFQWCDWLWLVSGPHGLDAPRP